MDIFYSLALQRRTTKDREPVSTTETLHFVYGRQEFFNLRIFDLEKIKSASHIACWEVIVYGNDDPEVICHTVDDKIDSSEFAEGIITFPVITRTDVFRDKTKSEKVHGWMEIRGLDSERSIVFSLRFKCVAEYSNDPSDNVPVEIVDDIATISWVKNFIAGSSADSFITKDMLESALSGMKIFVADHSIFQIMDHAVVKYDLSENDVILFDVSSLKHDVCATMELWLTMPETVVSFTMPDVTWVDDPVFDEGNTLYAVVVRWDGEKVLANVAYTLEVV